MKTKLITVLLLTFSYFAVKAQMIKQDKKWLSDSGQQVIISNTVQTSEYVFEGIIVDAKSYSEAGGTYVMQIIKIHKILKGSLICGTVQMISKDNWPPSNNDMVLPEDKNRTKLKGMSGMFFCTANSLPDQSVKTTKTDNITVLQAVNIIVYADIVSYAGELVDYRTTVRFNTFSQLYNSLLQEPGVQMKKCDSIDFQKKIDSTKRAPRHYKHYNTTTPQGNPKGPNAEGYNNLVIPLFKNSEVFAFCKNNSAITEILKNY